MKLIVEEYKYQSKEALKIIEGFNHITFKDGGVSTDSVGYCFNKKLDDCVFFVPKVVCDSRDMILGKYSPDQCVDFTDCEMTSEDKSFIRELCVWIYRALKEYSETEESTKILQEHFFTLVDSTGRSVQGTMLDKILALIRFYEENRDFFIFTIKNDHSQKHRINWSKTIARSSALIQEDVPLYLDPISKKKIVNWDEELMIIFFSIVNYLKKYGFNVQTDNYYELIKGEAFVAYLNGLGTRRLRQIKHRYFSDKTRRLWALCYSFFDTAETIVSSKDDSDYLIATSFHVAFEAMVDELIGQPELAGMRNLEDDKVIDHIYRDTSILSKDSVFFIGDSKYYKTRYSVKERSSSAFKQYTYARNVVQNCIKNSFDNTWPFRDPLTEGYCIIPNFFISAEIDPEHRYDLDGFEKEDVLGNPFSSRQFSNRLFDRDTLWVNQYNLNFLYLLSTYASGDYGLKEAFKKKTRRFFRDKTIELMNSKYLFWELKPMAGKTLEMTLSDMVKWELRGRIYSLGGEALLLAMEKPLAPEEEKNALFTLFERERDLERIKPVVEANFLYRRCALSKTEERILDYLGDADMTCFWPI